MLDEIKISEAIGNVLGTVGTWATTEITLLISSVVSDVSTEVGKVTGFSCKSHFHIGQINFYHFCGSFSRRFDVDTVHVF